MNNMYVSESLERKNVNILDAVPFLKKHPYLSLAAACFIINLSFRQGETLEVSPYVFPIVFFVVSFIAVSYLFKTVDNYVFSFRGAIFLVPIALFTVWGGVTVEKAETGIFNAAFVAALFLLSVFLILKFTKRLTIQNAILLIFLTGFVVRVMYALYTPIAEVSLRQHDVFRFIRQEGDELMETFSNRRHSEYIEYIARYFKLPDVDPSGGLSQLYHPPLHHILAALLLRFNMLVGMDYKAAVEGIQMLTVFYSASCMITAYKIFKELGFYGKGLLRGTALISLFPWFFVFSGSVNNDILSVALGFATLLWTIKWYKNPKIGTIISLAFIMGLSMATKLSMGLLAPAVALVFLVKFISVIKSKKTSINTRKGEKSVGALYLFLGFAAFAVIIFPLGLGWQIKNAILWDMPLAYVPKMGVTSDQYVAEFSTMERLFDFFSTGDTPFIVWGEESGYLFHEYNIFLGGLKTSLFDEMWAFELPSKATVTQTVISEIGTAVSVALYAFSILLVPLGIISFVKFVKNKFYSLNKTLVFMFVLAFAAFFGNYIIFCFSYPFTCTMNFRYAVCCLFLPAISISAVTQNKPEQCNLAEKAFYVANSVCVKGFCICSVLVYFLLALIPG